MADAHGVMRLLLRLNAPLGYVSSILLLLMMLSVIYDIVARLVFHAPTLWVIDINEYMLVYLTFLPAGWILLKDGHVKVELVTSRLGPRTQRVMGFITDLLGLLYCVILTWQSWRVTSEALQHDYRFSTALSLPQSPIFAIIPIGSAWLALAFLARLWTAWSQGIRAAPSGRE